MDGIRGLAVILIVAYHFCTVSETQPTTASQKCFAAMVSCLWCGVDLFFVLSGFLITGILLKTRRRENYFRDFYARRMLRIFPLAYTVIAAWFWIGAPLLRHLGQIPLSAQIPSSYQLWYWFFLENWIGVESSPPALLPFWSLAIEEQFYMVWPILVRVFPKRLSWICIGASAGSLCLRFSIFSALGAHAAMLYYGTFCRVDELMIGGMLALQFYQNESLKIFRRVALIAMSGFLGIAIWHSTAMFATPLMSVAGPTLLALSFAGLISIGLRSDTGIARALRWPMLTGAGKYSYALYIFHFPVIVVLKKLLPTPAGFWGQPVQMTVIAGPISFLLAFLSWNLLEKRMINLKDRYFAHSEPDVSMANV